MEPKITTKLSEKIVGSKAITTLKEELCSASILETEVGTNGLKGGDYGHGSRLYFRVEEVGGGIIETKQIVDSLGAHSGIEITLGGDTEIINFITFLRRSADFLESQLKK